MKKLTYLTVFVAVLGLMLIGCGKSTNPMEAPISGQIEQITLAKVSVNLRLPFAFPVDICTETVNVSGVFHVLISQTVSASGNILLHFHINAKGIGVGQTTNSTYQWNDVIEELTNVGPNLVFPSQTTFNRHIELIGRGGAANFTVEATFHTTINANNQVTVLFETVKLNCP